MRTSKDLAGAVMSSLLLSSSFLASHCSSDVASPKVGCQDVELSPLEAQILYRLVPDDASKPAPLTSAELTAKVAKKWPEVEKSLKALVKRNCVVERGDGYACSCRRVGPLEAHISAVLPSADSTENPLTAAALAAKLLAESPPEVAKALSSLLARHCVVKRGDGYLMRIVHRE